MLKDDKNYLNNLGALPTPEINFRQRESTNSEFHRSIGISSEAHGNYRTITPESLVKLMGKDNKSINLVILDCRFPYEYDAGSITGSINLVNHKTLTSLFNVKFDKIPVIVFFCEFSSMRSRQWCSALRGYDRKINAQNYPNLNFQYSFLLEGGYKKFNKKYKDKCTGEYISMTDDKFETC